MKKSIRRTLSVIACLVLVLSLAACGSKPASNAPEETVPETTVDTTTETTAETTVETTAETTAETTEGKGTSFTFIVKGPDGTETSFELRSEKEFVTEALLEAGLIEGEEGKYGFNVQTVNGITLDWQRDGKYWAFYINGEAAPHATSADTTPVTEGDVYSYVAQ